MALREQLAECGQSYQATVAVATCRDSLGFVDLYWPPIEPKVELQRLGEQRDPGVIFESPTRMVVIEEHSGELRYFAGGWCSHESRIYLEQERIKAEGHETGVFLTPQNAMFFAERFLAHQQALQDIEVPRLVHQRQETTRNQRVNRVT